MPSLLEAIELKYCSEEQETCEDYSFVIFAPKAGARQQVPRLLVLSDCSIDSAGNEEALKKICSGVVEIDLSRNKLNSWTEVSKVLLCSQSVTFLNLSFNDLSMQMTEVESLNFPELHQLKILILIGTKITWESMWFILQKACNLEELHISLNNFANVEDKALSKTHNSFKTVQKLMFNGNPVSDWKEIAKLGKHFPELKHLTLADTSLHSIPSEAYTCFENLQTLSVCNTPISQIDDLAQINSFPSLKEIRLTGLSFWSDLTEHERRQRYIAVLPKISKLNGGAVISASDREGAERAYIRFFADQENPPERYHELVEQHGKLDPLVNVDMKPKTNVKLQIYYDDTSIERDVKMYQSVAEFKTELEFITGVKASIMKLYYVDIGLSAVFGREIMKYPQKQLYSYSMTDGDEIYIE